MKKKIANALELVLLVVTYVLIRLPLLSVQYVKMARELPIEVSALGISAKGTGYIINAVYLITAAMCLISIFVKAEHKDGIMHVVMPIILFFNLITVSTSVGTVVGDFKIVESHFPTSVFTGLFVAIVVISIAKRSTIIAGLPETTNSK